MPSPRPFPRFFLALGLAAVAFAADGPEAVPPPPPELATPAPVTTAPPAPTPRGDGTNRPSDSAPSSLFRVGPEVTFFPPTPTVFRAPISNTAAPRRVRAPAELAEYVGEFLYPALGTRLAEGTLGRDIASRLDEYRSRRVALFHEIIDRNAAELDTEPERREQNLRTFAAAQSPRLAALENEAERLRDELIRGGIFKISADWSRFRTWRMGETAWSNEAYEKEAEFQVTRAAAYYQSGLVPAQRGLLREVAFDLQGQARTARGFQTLRPDDATIIWFHPETARLRLPSRLPPELSALIGRFNGDKAALKRELAAAVLAQDTALPGMRAAAFAALADAQWPRLLALDDLAEQIRVGLAALPTSPLSAPPSIPAELLARMETYNHDRAAFYRDMAIAVQTAVDLVSSTINPWAPPEDRARQRREYTAARLAAQNIAIESFQRESTQRFLGLQQRYQYIRDDLTVIAQRFIDPATGKPHTAASLMEARLAAIDAFDSLGREETIYRNYRLAMLQPGFSAEQRRLLFTVAQAGLAQPLPGGEPMPRTSLPVAAP